jgi:hypothetical protein
MQRITTIGLDIAKSVFPVHGVDAAGKVVIRRQLKRRYVLAFFQKLPPCLIGIQACASSHYWSRELQALGHIVRLMPPAYVKPYVKRQKNDTADAEAICEAVTRATMRFVPTKTPEQQSCLMLQPPIEAMHARDRRGASFHQPGQRAVALPALPPGAERSRIAIARRQRIQTALAGRGIVERAEIAPVVQSRLAWATGRRQERRDRSPFARVDHGETHGLTSIAAGLLQVVLTPFRVPNIKF